MTRASEPVCRKLMGVRCTLRKNFSRQDFFVSGSQAPAWEPYCRQSSCFARGSSIYCTRWPKQELGNEGMNFELFKAGGFFARFEPTIRASCKMVPNFQKERRTAKFMRIPEGSSMKIPPSGSKTTDFCQVGARLWPATWHSTLSPPIAQLISLSNWSANRAMIPNIR